MSWIMRSWTTPTSSERNVNGAVRAASTTVGMPILATAACHAGLNRSTWPTATVRPCRRAAITIARASSADAAIGFSTSRSIPASSSGTATPACSPVGAATTAASTQADELARARRRPGSHGPPRTRSRRLGDRIDHGHEFGVVAAGQQPRVDRAQMPAAHHRQLRPRHAALLRSRARPCRPSCCRVQKVEQFARRAAASMPCDRRISRAGSTPTFAR